MRAELSATISDITIRITPQELYLLASQSLTCPMRIIDTRERAETGTLTPRDLTLAIHDCGSELQSIISHPINADFERITHYDLRVCSSVYQQLHEKGAYINRYSPFASKLEIYVDRDGKP